jgi:predicted dehydrogenase
VEVHSARFANQNHEDIHLFADTGTVHFSLRDGAMGSLNFSTAIWDRNFESTLTVIGDRGTVKLGGQYMNDLRYCHVEGLLQPDLPASSPANNYGPYTGSAANHHFVIDNVVNVLHGREEVATTAQEGLDVVRVIEAIYRAGEKR